MCFVLSVDLGKWQHLVDAINAAKNCTKLTLSDLLALEVRFWLATHTAVLLLDVFEIYFNPIGFQTILVSVTQ